MTHRPFVTRENALLVQTIKRQEKFGASAAHAALPAILWFKKLARFAASSVPTFALRRSLHQHPIHELE
jgi:hypothetical protein